MGEPGSYQEDHACLVNLHLTQKKEVEEQHSAYS